MMRGPQAAPRVPRAGVAVAVVLLHAALGVALVATAAVHEHARPAAPAPAVLWVPLDTPQVRAVQPAPTAPTATTAPTVTAQAPRAQPKEPRVPPPPPPPPAIPQPVLPPPEPLHEPIAPMPWPPQDLAVAEAPARVASDTPSGPASVPEAAPFAAAAADPETPTPVKVAAASRTASPATHGARHTEPDHGACPPARHPAALRDRGVEGQVQLRVLVGAEGRAREVQVVAPSGWRLFDEAARLQALQCRFVPATADGVPVERWVTYPVVFALSATATDRRHAVNLR